MRRVAPIALLLLSLAPVASAAELPVCHGKDLIAELAAKDPVAYAAIKAEAEKAENYEAKLWKIEKQGLAASYLFGTVNSTDPRAATLSEKVVATLSEVSTVVLPIVDASPEPALAAQRSHFFLSDSDSLSNYLSAEEYAALGKAYRDGKSEIGETLLRRLQPWAASKMMPKPDCVAVGAQAQLGPAEARIEELARSNRKEVIALLSVDEMLNTVFAVPMPYQVDALRSDVAFVAEQHNWQDHKETLTILYVQNRLAEYRPFAASIMIDKQLARRVQAGLQEYHLDPTSKRLRDRSLPLLEKGGVFIAVTNGYLPGDKGLVALFREAGYTVTPVE